LPRSCRKRPRQERSRLGEMKRLQKHGRKKSRPKSADWLKRLSNAQLKPSKKLQDRKHCVSSRKKPRAKRSYRGLPMKRHVWNKRGSKLKRQPARKS
jgi:hypothetical protein